jgi:hypothetical protein
VFTARYALSPYIKQMRFFFKGLMYNMFRPKLKKYFSYLGRNMLHIKVIYMNLMHVKFNLFQCKLRIYRYMSREMVTYIDMSREMVTAALLLATEDTYSWWLDTQQ